MSEEKISKLLDTIKRLISGLSEDISELEKRPPRAKRMSRRIFRVNIGGEVKG